LLQNLRALYCKIFVLHIYVRYFHHIE